MTSIKITTVVLKGYNKAILDSYSSQIKKLVEKSGAMVCFEKRERKKVTTLHTPNRDTRVILLKSPHVYKKFKDDYVQTESTTSIKLRDIDTDLTLRILASLNPADNDVRITFTEKDEKILIKKAE